MGVDDVGSNEYGKISRKTCVKIIGHIDDGAWINDDK